MCFRPVQCRIDLGRHLRVIVEHEIVPGQHPGQILRPHLLLLVDRDRRVVGADDAGEHLGQIVDGIQEQTLHARISLVAERSVHGQARGRQQGAASRRGRP